jgi:creatinine amidohydrolase
MHLQRSQIIALVCVLGLSSSPSARQAQNSAPVNKSQRLERLAWPEAETVLTPETVVVVPLGAASKEHGPHLKLRNDLTLADYLPSVSSTRHRSSSRPR